MNDDPEMPEGDLPWLDASGPDGRLVISTRVRLARNLVDLPFAGRNNSSQREVIVARATEAARATASLADAQLYRLDDASVTVRRWLHERQLISRELAAIDGDATIRSGAALLRGGAASVLVNEEDHFRVLGLRSGFALDAAYRAASRADRELGLRVSFAFHPEFGYLTACPTNVGTGLRASVLIHLPALVLTKEIAKVLHGLAQVGLTHRGLFGEGSDVLGNLFQLSNQTTLGKSEAELLDHLARMVRQVIDYEERARELLRRDAPSALEDTVWRAWAVLRYARTLSFDEALSLLSGVRLGVAVQILPDVPLYTLNRMLVVTQAAHVAQWAGVSPDDPELSQHRARMVRRMVEEVGPG